MVGSYDLKILIFLVIGVVVVVVSLWFALRSVGMRLLGFDFPNLHSCWLLEKDGDWAGIRRILLAPNKNQIRKLAKNLNVDKNCLNMRREKHRNRLQQLSEGTVDQHNKVIMVSELMALKNDRAAIMTVLNVLNKLNVRSEYTLIIVTERFPFFSLTEPEMLPWSHSPNSEDSEVWVNLFSQFECGFLYSNEEYAPIERLLRQECGFSELEGIRQSIRKRWAFSEAVRQQKNLEKISLFKNLLQFFRTPLHLTKPLPLTEREIVDEVSARAMLFHRSLWGRCSPKERYLLYRMAQGNMVNCLNVHPLKRLLRLGLLRKDPSLRIASHSLRRFILDNEEPEDVIEWEESEHESIWTFVRIPLLMLFLSLAVFLAYVGPDVVEAMLGLLPAIALALPLMMRFFSGRASK